MRASRPVFDLEDLVELESSPAPAKASSRGTDVTLPSVERVVPPRDSRPPEKDDGFDALCDQAIAALLAKDYRTATMLFAEAQTLRPDDARVNANLKRLSEIGYAAVVGSPDRRDP